MKKFSIDMSVLRTTINELEQSIKQINTLKKKVVQANLELTESQWSGKSAKKFQKNSSKWRNNFQEHIENLNKMQETLKEQVLPKVLNLNNQANAMSICVGGSARSYSELGKVTLDWNSKTEVCNLCDKIIVEYETYVNQLSQLKTLNGKLCYTGFSVASEAESAITEIHNVQHMLRSLKSAMNTYQNSVEELESTMVAAMEEIEMPQEWAKGANLLLSRLTIACGDLNITKLLKELIKMLKGFRHDCCDYGGDPINLATGNFAYHREYLQQKGLYPMEFSMVYNSVERQDGALGNGWVHNYQIYLIKNPQSVVLHWSDGREETFIREGEGQYSHITGKGDTLMEIVEGMVYKTELGVKYTFDNEGRNTKIEDSNDNWLKLSYDFAGRLAEVKSISGETLRYAYNEEGFISEVSDGAGRIVRLFYTEGYLTKVSDEENNTFRYAYDANGALSEVTNGRNIQSLGNEYDAQGRVIKQSYPDGGCMKLEYDDENRIVRVTEQNGNEVAYVHDECFRSVETIFTDGKVQYAYNDRNQKTQVIDKRGYKTTYDYDNAGNLSMVVNPMGEKLEMTYNAMHLMTGVKICDEEFLHSQYDLRGNLVCRKDALGREYRISYSKSGKPIKVKQPDGSKIALTYDEHGNVSSIQEPLGGEVHYEYNELGQVTATTDGNGNRTEYAYNQRGHIVAITNAEGNTKHIQYNEAGKVTCIENFDGSKIQCEYNEINKPCRIIDPEGNVTQFEYDSMWNMTCRTEANGSKTRFFYNKLNQLERIVNAKGAEIRYEYDPNGNKVGVVDSNGSNVKMEYDALNRLIALTDADGAVSHMAYNQFGQQIKTIDAMGNVRRNVYDKAGQKIAAIDARGNKTTYEYNALGKISRIIDAAGQAIAYEYLPGGLLEKVIYENGTSISYTYDKNRNVKSRTNQEGYTFYYTYDSMNRIIEIASSDGQHKQYSYNPLGKVSSATDGNGNTTKYFYSPAGHLIRVEDALGNSTHYSYDEIGNLSEISQCGLEPELTEACKQNERNQSHHFVQYQRDILGHIETVTDALGNQEHYTYNEMGYLVEKQDKEGFVTTFGYTKGGKLSEIQYADGNSVKLSYNPLKQLVEIQDWLGTTKVEVDELGRAEKVTDTKGREVHYKRDAFGNCVEMQYPDGKTVEYGYDQWRRLTSLKDEHGEFHYSYDNNNRLCEKVFPNGMKTNYIYGIDGMIRQLSHWDKEGLLEDYKYQYDTVGNRVGIQRERRGLPEESGSYHYGYDALNRLIAVEKEGTLLRSYGYDAYGNRSFMEKEGERTEYFYNEAQQLMQSVTNGSQTEYAYDKRGNLIQMLENGVQSHGYEYDCRNQMYQAFDDAGRRSVYTYNGLGMRVEEQRFEGENPLKTVEFVLNQTRRYHNLLQQVEDGNTRDFLWDGNVVGETSKEDIYYYLQDEMGSPVRYLNADGDVKENYAFDEFGNDLYRKKEQLQPFGYTGYYQDMTAGTWFAQAREYMPQTGRFAARDKVKGMPIAPYTLNEYNYCWNRPLAFVDYDGAFPSLEEITGSIEAGAQEMGDWLDEQIANIGPTADAATAGFFTATDYVWEHYIPNPMKKDLADKGREKIGKLRDFVEKDRFFGIDISDVMAFASVTPIGETFLDAFSFTRTKDGVYHSDRECWQQYFGYNDVYDYAFGAATSMKPKKYQFQIKDGTTYTIWMWKGDYLNLGAGCETGIYVGDGFHVECGTGTNLHMTLNLYDKRTGKKIFEYDPDEPQWWITGFNPKFQDMDSDNLDVHGSIDFSDEPELWEAFFNEYKDEGGWCFDEENMVAYYQW